MEAAKGSAHRFRREAQPGYTADIDGQGAASVARANRERLNGSADNVTSAEVDVTAVGVFANRRA